MQLIKQSVENITPSSFPMINQEYVACRQIETVGRICTRSLPKQTDISALPFVTDLISRKHESVLEHHFIELRSGIDCFVVQSKHGLNWFDVKLVIDEIFKPSAHCELYYEKMEVCGGDRQYPRLVIRINHRALRNIFRKKNQKELSPIALLSLATLYSRIVQEFPTLYQDLHNQVPHTEGLSDTEPNISPLSNDSVLFHSRLFFESLWIDQARDWFSFKYITDRACSHELVRHRSLCPMQESQRYVAEREDVTFIDPSEIFGWDKVTRNIWLAGLRHSEKTYKKMLATTKKAEQARMNLPNSTATVVILTGTQQRFEDFFELRCSPKAFAPVRLLAEDTRNLMEEYYLQKAVEQRELTTKSQ